MVASSMGAGAVRLEGGRVGVSRPPGQARREAGRSGAAPQPEIYWPYAQVPRWGIHFVIRSAVPPETLIPGSGPASKPWIRR